YGGALAREKVVDYAAKKFVVIVNKEKFVPVLKGRLPVEVLPFAAPLVEKALGEISVGGQLRKKKGSDELFVTDNGNWIFDAQFDEVVLPRDLEQDLNLIPGVVENGLFSRNISAVVVGTEDGAEVKKR
ncbi:MAG: ribose-5-phosphate isomerase A, partial [Candidatus Micrarchaeia archaeon]